jgi:hypothetical protein
VVECAPLEPCHSGECDGFNEVLALLPQGKIWRPADSSVHGRFIAALGHIKTEWNQAICQVWGEANPCTARATFGYWAGVYGFPPCAPQTNAKLCEWIALLDGPCPIGSLGFYQAAIDFVAPGAGITISKGTLANVDGWQGSNECTARNALVITAPAAAYRFTTVDVDAPFEDSDCRIYFIPEIECLRKCVFPFGFGLGYRTTGAIDDGVHGVPATAGATLPQLYYKCEVENCNG